MRWYLWSLCLMPTIIFSMNLSEEEKRFLQSIAETQPVIPGRQLFALNKLNSSIEQIKSLLADIKKILEQSNKSDETPQISERSLATTKPWSESWLAYGNVIKEWFNIYKNKPQQAVPWLKEHKKMVFLYTIAGFIALNNLRIAWYRYNVWRTQQWSLWRTKNELQRHVLFLEALCKRYCSLHPDADLNVLKAYFLRDVSNELYALEGYQRAAHYSVAITNFLQKILYHCREGFIGFFGNGGWVRRFFTLFFGVLRPDYIIWGDAAFLKEVNQRSQDLINLQNLLYSVLALHYVPQRDSPAESRAALTI